MIPQNVTLHTTWGCNHQSFACLSYTYVSTLAYCANLRPWQRSRLLFYSVPRTQTRASWAAGKILTTRQPLCYSTICYTFRQTHFMKSWMMMVWKVELLKNCIHSFLFRKLWMQFFKIVQRIFENCVRHNMQCFLQWELGTGVGMEISKQ